MIDCYHERSDQINVPAGEPELNASVRLADTPNNSFYAWLIGPAAGRARRAGNPGDRNQVRL